MQYELTIPPESLQAHLDIEKDIERRKDGLFTFILRVHNGKITDYSLMEVIDAKTKYLSLARISVQEQMVSRYYRE